MIGLSKNSNGKWQLAEIPVIYWNEDGTKVVAENFPYDLQKEYSLEYMAQDITTLGPNDIVHLNFLDRKGSVTGLQFIYELHEVIGDMTFNDEFDFDTYLASGDIKPKNNTKVTFILPDHYSIVTDN